MSQKNIKVKNDGSKFFIELHGVLDEDVNFTEVNLLDPQDIVVNFENVQSINSCGIREWIRWLMRYGASNITYEKCPKIIVDQINMVDGFLPNNGTVNSFFVPYYSEESGVEKQILFSFGKEFDHSNINPPTEVKGDDGSPMEMDVIENKYFKFLLKKNGKAA